MTQISTVYWFSITWRKSILDYQTKLNWFEIYHYIFTIHCMFYHASALSDLNEGEIKGTKLLKMH